MSSIDFVSEHATASLHGSEGHYLLGLPAQLTLGLLQPAGLNARERFAEILAPESGLHAINDAAFAAFFPSAWSYGEGFAWRGCPLDTFQISLNTALAVGSDPIRLAARLGFAGYPWVDGPDRAWLADVIDQGVTAGVFRGPGQGWDEVAAMLRARDDEPVVIADSTGSRDFPTPYLGGWFSPELGSDYRLLTEEQEKVWDERADAWHEVDAAQQWRISLAALRADPHRSLQMSPGTWTDLYFGNGITAFDLIAHNRAARLDRACRIQAQAVAAT